MNKIIIDNKSDLTISESLKLVSKVVNMGKISNNEEQHCYLTTFMFGPDLKKYVVATMLNRKSEKFIVQNDF